MVQPIPKSRIKAREPKGAISLRSGKKRHAATPINEENEAARKLVTATAVQSFLWDSK